MQNHTCVDILNVKYEFSNELLPEFSSKPRQPSKPDVQGAIITAFIQEPDKPSLLFGERYSNAENSWKKFGQVSLPFSSVHAVLEWGDTWFIISEVGWIVRVNMDTLAVSDVPEMPNSCENFAAVLHNDCIYTIYGEEIQQYALFQFYVC